MELFDKQQLWAAKTMRELDEPLPNALIAQSDNCIDIRDRFEKASVPWDMIDDYDGDDYA